MAHDTAPWAESRGRRTTLSQNAWLPVLRTLGLRLWSEGRLLVPRANTVFDEDGNLTDGKVREQLATFVEAFAAFAKSSSVDR